MTVGQTICDWNKGCVPDTSERQMSLKDLQVQRKQLQLPSERQMSLN